MVAGHAHRGKLPGKGKNNKPDSPEIPLWGTAKSAPLPVHVAHSLQTIFRATPTVANIIAYPPRQEDNQRQGICLLSCPQDV